MNTKQQGDIGVAMAIAYYTQSGYTVSSPLTDNARYDLVVERNGTFYRIQCKTTNFYEKYSYRVTLRTKGGNKTGTTTKKISAEECDILFVYTLDGKMYEFPATVFDGMSSMSLGPSKEQYVVATYTTR